jgi:hypothetical protein
MCSQELHLDVHRCGSKVVTRFDSNLVTTGSKEEEILTPGLTERSREQATLFLVGYAWVGDTGARDLPEIVFPEPGPK